jgi:threonine/homoserine/homoserine lactone efflux protein
MSGTEFTALLVLATAMSFTPGPNTALSAAMAANHGLRHAMPFVCAVPVGWGLLLSLSAMGLGTLLLTWPMLTLTVKWVGVAYLLWLALQLASSSNLRAADARRFQVGFWQGTALQFVNIKAWVLALAIVSGWVAGHADPLSRFAIVLPVMVFYAFVSNLSYALVGTVLRHWLSGPEGTGLRLRWFNRLMAALLLFTAVWLLLR